MKWVLKGGGQFPAMICVVLLVAPAVHAQTVTPDVGLMLERTLQEAENFRKELSSSEYEATMHIQEWDGRGRLRGTADAKALVRPGDARSMTFLTREVRGKVRLPKEKRRSKEDEDEDKTTLQDFAREHRIAERFVFTVSEGEEIFGDRARRIGFTPRDHQPEKNTADRFLDSITGAAWVTEEKNRLVKFEMRLMHPFQLLWVFAILKEFSIQYELIAPGEILGHAKMKVLFALTTPLYTFRQQHDVDLDHFRRREMVLAQNQPSP
jgi:hypothetical protein